MAQLSVAGVSLPLSIPAVLYVCMLSKTFATRGLMRSPMKAAPPG